LFTVVGAVGAVELTSDVLGGELGAVDGPGSLVVAPQPTQASTAHNDRVFVNSDISLLLFMSNLSAPQP
jgi:hypothetical protein